MTHISCESKIRSVVRAGPCGHFYPGFPVSEISLLQLFNYGSATIHENRENEFYRKVSIILLTFVALWPYIRDLQPPFSTVAYRWVRICFYFQILVHLQCNFVK